MFIFFYKYNMILFFYLIDLSRYKTIDKLVKYVKSMYTLLYKYNYILMNTNTIMHSGKITDINWK